MRRAKRANTTGHAHDEFRSPLSTYTIRHSPPRPKKSVCARFPRSTPQRCTQINRISQRTRLAHFTLAGKIVQREENRIEFFTLKALKTILTDAVPRSGRKGNVVEGVPVDGSFGQEPIGIERLRVLKVHPAMKSLIYLVRWITNNPKKGCAKTSHAPLFTCTLALHDRRGSIAGKFRTDPRKSSSMKASNSLVSMNGDRADIDGRSSGQCVAACNGKLFALGQSVEQH